MKFEISSDDWALCILNITVLDCKLLNDSKTDWSVFGLENQSQSCSYLVGNFRMRELDMHIYLSSVYCLAVS